MKDQSRIKNPVMFLHGFMGTSVTHFGYILRYWYKKYSLIAVDLPGHGHSPSPAKDKFFKYSVEYIIKKIQKFDRINLIGMSYLGGTLAHRIGLEYPHLINSLVLTGFTYDVPKEAFLAWTNSFKELALKNPELAKEYEKLHGSRWKHTMDCLINDCNQSYENTAFTTLEMIKNLKIRGLLINGDLKQNETNAALIINRITPYLSGVIVNKAGHIVPHDQPKVFCEIVEKFWRQKDVTSQ